MDDRPCALRSGGMAIEESAPFKWERDAYGTDHHECGATGDTGSLRRGFVLSL